MVVGKREHDTCLHREGVLSLVGGALLSRGLLFLAGGAVLTNDYCP